MDSWFFIVLRGFMKRFFAIVSIFVLLALTSLQVNAKVLDFAEGFSLCDKKPLLVLIVADWSEASSAAKKQFKLVQKAYADKLNFAVLDVADDDAAYYNSKFRFEQNIPYIMFFRNGGKVSRFLNQECALNAKSCIIPRVKSFLQ